MSPITGTVPTDAPLVVGELRAKNVPEGEIDAGPGPPELARGAIPTLVHILG
jgi:hypothetical protein